jgi:hypothetical protein
MPTNVRVHSDQRLLDVDRLENLLQGLHSWLHEAGMEATTHWQHLGASEVILRRILPEKLQSLEGKKRGSSQAKSGRVTQRQRPLQVIIPLPCAKHRIYPSHKPLNDNFPFF